jgi:glutamate racemase
MVLFLDSGVGGLVYLEMFRERMPHINCEYLADSAFFPYGDRHPDEVRHRVVHLVQTRLQLRNNKSSPSRHGTNPDSCRPSAVVIACNTASVVALPALRRQFPDIAFIGVVPAIKPAARATRSGHIAVFATNHTAVDPYTDGLVRQFARYCRVSRYGLPRVVQAAEDALCGDESPVRRVIREEMLSVFDPSIDTVVLACTHFVRYRNLFLEILGSSVQVIDSLEGVVNRTISVMSPPVSIPRDGLSGTVTLYYTGPDGSRLRCLEDRYRPLRFDSEFALMPGPESGVDPAPGPDPAPEGSDR